MGASNETKDRKEFEDMRTGIQKDFPPNTPLPLGGQSLTPQQIDQTFGAAIDAMGKVVALKAQLKAATDDEHLKVQTARALHTLVRDYLRTIWTKGDPRLADFGIAPRKVANVSAGDRSKAALKGAETRKEVGPTGVRQREAAAKALKDGKVSVLKTGSGGGGGGSGSGSGGQ